MLTFNPQPSLSTSDIPIVSEYTDGFPEDVMSLPPEREVEFSIDLASPRVLTYISCPIPYVPTRTP
jgi:hypothetical protein